jgi:hypothetical protein
MLAIACLAGVGHAATLAREIGPAADTTPPVNVTVTDDGQYTPQTSEVHATWSAEDPESGIDQYEYAVSSTTGAAGIVANGNWQNVGTATQGTRTSLALAEGQTYYVLVRATNSVGLTSAEAHSDGIMVAPAVESIGLAKALADGTPVSLRGKRATSNNYGGFFYLEELDRSSGIRIAGGRKRRDRQGSSTWRV